MQNSYSNDTAGYEYAGFWIRFAAYLLDNIIVFFALFSVRLAVSGIMAAVEGTVRGGNLLFQYNLKDIVLYLSEALYFILCTYYAGTTLGKKAMNLRVISAGGEEKPGFLTIVYRETVGRFLSGVIVGVGYLMIGIDKEKRGIHDILCDTRVIYAKRIKVFKMETAFTPLAEPMGRVPEQEAMPKTYSMQTVPKKAEPEKEILKEQILEVNTEKVSGETSRMPWDAPYIGQKDVCEPDEQALSEAAGVSEDVHEPDEQTSQKNDTDTTTERDS